MRNKFIFLFGLILLPVINICYLGPTPFHGKYALVCPGGMEGHPVRDVPIPIGRKTQQVIESYCLGCLLFPGGKPLRLRAGCAGVSFKQL